MPVEFDRGSPGKFDSRTLNRETLNRWTGRIMKFRNKKLCSGGFTQPATLVVAVV